MNKYSSIRFVQYLLLCLLLAGCGTRQLYSEKFLEGEKTAAITVQKGAGKGVYMLGIYQDRYEEGVEANTLHSRFVILTGKTKLFVHYYDVSKGLLYGVDGTLTFNAFTNHEYYLGGEQRNGITFFWLEDMQTKEVVAGARPK